MDNRYPRAPHNRVSNKLKGLKPGDFVTQEDDQGVLHNRTVKYPPQIMGGTWVVWLNGVRGCYALSRCKPRKPTVDEQVAMIQRAAEDRERQDWEMEQAVTGEHG